MAVAVAAAAIVVVVAAALALKSIFEIETRHLFHMIVPILGFSRFLPPLPPSTHTRDTHTHFGQTQSHSQFNLVKDRIKAIKFNIYLYHTEFTKRSYVCVCERALSI